MQPGRFCAGLSVDNVKQALCATFAEEYGDYQILELSEEALKEIQGLLQQAFLLAMATGTDTQV